ncbi:hypothetical protein AAEX28_09080 [Lentisphaerota bacterium WC36G]|nr:hypothetical protein LJT99_11930 [Lentisphaerae bacterium WC36]
MNLITILKGTLVLTFVVIAFFSLGCVSLDQDGVKVNNNIERGNPEWQTFPTYNR